MIWWMKFEGAAGVSAGFAASLVGQAPCRRLYGSSVRTSTAQRPLPVLPGAMMHPGADLGYAFHRQEVGSPARLGEAEVMRDAVEECPGEHVAGAGQVLGL